MQLSSNRKFRKVQQSWCLHFSKIFIIWKFRQLFLQKKNSITFFCILQVILTASPITRVHGLTCLLRGVNKMQSSVQSFDKPTGQRDSEVMSCSHVPCYIRLQLILLLAYSSEILHSKLMK